MRELSVITYPHLRILPITSADNPRNISSQFTHLNIRTSAAPHIRILPETSYSNYAAMQYKGATTVLKLGGPSAERGGMWGGGVPSPHWGRGLGREPCPLPRKFYDFFIWKWWVLVHSGWRFRTVCSYCIRGKSEAEEVVILDFSHAHTSPCRSPSLAKFDKYWKKKKKKKRKSRGEGRHSALIGERPIHQILYFHLCWK